MNAGFRAYSFANSGYEIWASEYYISASVEEKYHEEKQISRLLRKDVRLPSNESVVFSSIAFSILEWVQKEKKKIDTGFVFVFYVEYVWKNYFEKIL